MKARRRHWLRPVTVALALAAWLLASPLVADTHDPPEAKPAAPDSVLFVGNSFTFYNNSIHTHLRHLLESDDPSLRDSVFLKSMTISGAVLSDHDRGLKQMLEQWDWDVVVLQGHSLEALEPDSRANFETSAARLVSMAVEDGARPVLFMTWAYSDQPEMTAKLKQEYSRLGEELGVMVVPVGLAFEQAPAELPGLSLHTADFKHPTLEGTYLAACVFYSALWRKSAEPLDYGAGLPDDVAEALRLTAWRTVQQYYGIQ
ncbi:MAG: hypothetical protein KJN78_00420 [Gammaproteobacteria bacterium]|nr:hypothetical protein [Gammaproteobacteria bacterium]